jgi:hypothetical protein
VCVLKLKTEKNHSRERLYSRGMPAISTHRVQQHDTVVDRDHTSYGPSKNRPSRLGANRGRQELVHHGELDNRRRGRRHAHARDERDHEATLDGLGRA